MRSQMSWNSASFTLSPSEPNFVSTHLGPHCSMSLKRDSHAVAQPAGVQGLPEATVRDGQHGRVVGPVQILVVEPVAAHAG
eukprot:5586753-Heterocapsa_arctica.AAC.2